MDNRPKSHGINAGPSMCPLTDRACTLGSMCIHQCMHRLVPALEPPRATEPSPIWLQKRLDDVTVGGKTNDQIDREYAVQEMHSYLDAEVREAASTTDPLSTEAGFDQAARERATFILPVVSQSAARKASPVFSGVLNYFPDALMAVARVSKAGNDKHNPGQPLHWSRGKSDDHMDCAARHMLTPYEIDPDSKEAHLANAVWRLLAELQLYQEKQRGA